MSRSKLLDQKQFDKLTQKLEEAYKDAKYYLNFNTPLELLVAAILSAQTKDEVVNRATPALFAKFKATKDYAHAKPEEVIKHVRSISFAGNKVKNIIGSCKIIEQKHNGKVPSSMEELTELPGIGRKTANTILINAFNIVEGIPVDTWVIKLSYRLGLSTNKNPDKIEEDLEKKLNKRYWHNFAYVLKTHGKKICQTIPYCSKCPVNDVCPKNGVVQQR
jgi:endonuclease-3